MEIRDLKLFFLCRKGSLTVGYSTRRMRVTPDNPEYAPYFLPAYNAYKNIKKRQA